jgi:hypothetical protein
MAESDAVSVVLPGRVVVTRSGVYRPPMYKAEAAASVLALLMLAATLAFKPASGGVALAGMAGLAILIMARLVAYRQHGPLGPPMLALQGNALTFRLPQDTRGQVTENLARYQQLIVYGAAGRRIFRLVRQDGVHTEVRPGWTVALEDVAIDFVQRSLPQVLRVTVEEPQTAFASIRGDGPA